MVKALSTIKNFLFNSEIRFGYLTKLGFYNKLSDEKFLKRQYQLKTGISLNLENPKTFNEKLQWYKIHYQNPLMTQCADKVKVKEYVKRCGLQEYLVENYGVFDKFSEISLDRMPDEFFLKCNNGSGLNCLIKKKNITPKIWKKLEHEFTGYLHQNYYWRNREWAYKEIKPKLLCEQYLKPEDGEPLIDLNLYYFHGQLKIIYMNVGLADGNGRHSKAQRAIFDEHLEYIPEAKTQMDNLPTDKAKLPAGTADIVEKGRILAEPFPFARVDFFYVNKRFHFGEITFYSAAGYVYLEPQSLYDMLGESFDITKIRQE